MAGIFFDELRQLDFFPGAQDEKRVQNCGSPIPSAHLISNSDHLNPGIYQEEESIDLSALLQAYNSDASSTTSPTLSTSNNDTSVSVQSSPSAYQDSHNTNSSYQVFHQNFLGGTEHISNCLPSMYGSENFNSQMLSGNVEMTPSPTSLTVECRGVPTNSSPHVVHIDPVPTGTFPVMRPAPGKAQRSGKLSKKMLLDKRSEEYKTKRAKNNDAVRKSREKSKVRVHDTEKRVKELEDENNQLQSKIALLTKELHVLKSLFTSAGVSQPPSFQVEEEGLGRN